MYQERKEKLRENEIKRMVRQYLYWRRKFKNPDGDYTYIKNLPYEELPCEERASLREYAEKRLLELEKDEIPYLIKHNELILTKFWPRNLYESIFGEQIILLPDSEKTLLSALHSLHPTEEKCMLKFYQERKRWDEVCDELDIYEVELHERICKSLRKLRRPSISKELAKCVVFTDNNNSHKEAL